MPGKVNPVMPEAVTQAAMQVIANDQAITLAASSGCLELNPFLPLIAHCLLESCALLADALLGILDASARRGLAAERWRASASRASAPTSSGCHDRTCTCGHRGADRAGRAHRTARRATTVGRRRGREGSLRDPPVRRGLLTAEVRPIWSGTDRPAG